MAEIWTPGMARAARAWVCVMLPEPIRPMCVVMGASKQKDDTKNTGVDLENSEKRREKALTLSSQREGHRGHGEIGAPTATSGRECLRCQSGGETTALQ